MGPTTTPAAKAPATAATVRTLRFMRRTYVLALRPARPRKGDVAMILAASSPGGKPIPGVHGLPVAAQLEIERHPATTIPRDRPVAKLADRLPGQHALPRGGIQAVQPSQHEMVAVAAIHN